MKRRGLDPVTTVMPVVLVIILCICFSVWPQDSTRILGKIRDFLGDRLSAFYLMIGLGVFLVSLWIAFSDIGKIRLGKPGEQPQYSFFRWGAMIFTCGLAADILFYGLCEWIYYASDPHVQGLGSIQDWAPAYALFHWGPIPWSFYAVLAACFGFMLHIRQAKRQKFSESCRGILGAGADGFPGKLIDFMAVIALIAGTATTFSVSMPLMSGAFSKLAGIRESKFVTLVLLAAICAAYTTCVWKGMSGVSWLANLCMYVYMALLLYVLVLGGRPIYLIETGLSAIGTMAQNFIHLATWTDALRETSFPQNWTCFYWAYWMVWCVASPFFMGKISRGRTIKQVILGISIFGISSTSLSFVILGNFGLGLQMEGKYDAVGRYMSGGDIYGIILGIIDALPCASVVLLMLVITMAAFYATSFDSITLVAAAYSYQQYVEEGQVGKGMKLFWAIVLILFPSALILSEEGMQQLQAVSMIAAFPIGGVIILIISSFIKDAGRYMEEERYQNGKSEQ